MSQKHVLSFIFAIPHWVVEEFPKVRWKDVQGLRGLVDLLIWFYNNAVFPVKKASRDSMALLSLGFGTGWMLAGRTVTDCGMWVTALWDHGGGGQYGSDGIQATGLHIVKGVGY